MIRVRAREEGQAAALEPRSRRPRTSRTQVSEERKQEALKVRAAWESPGLNRWTISEHDKMKSLGFQSPSIALVTRIFREKNVSRSEPSKKPRTVYRRFVYPAPNACW